MPDDLHSTGLAWDQKRVCRRLDANVLCSHVQGQPSQEPWVLNLSTAFSFLNQGSDYAIELIFQGTHKCNRYGHAGDKPVFVVSLLSPASFKHGPNIYVFNMFIG